MVSNCSGNRLSPIAPPYGVTTQSTQGKSQVNQANHNPTALQLVVLALDVSSVVRQGIEWLIVRRVASMVGFIY